MNVGEDGKKKCKYCDQISTHSDLIDHINQEHFIAQDCEEIFEYRCLKCDQKFKLHQEIRQGLLLATGRSSYFGLYVWVVTFNSFSTVIVE